MDTATLTALVAAWQASPENGDLAAVVWNALADAKRLDEAQALVAGAPESLREHAGACAAAGAVLLALGRPGQALGWLNGDAPVVLLQRARALAALGERDLALHAYDAATDGDPTLEDANLAATIRALVDDGTPHDAQPVIANDDTDDDDVRRLLQPDPDHDGITFANVGGLDGVKKEIHRRIILPFQKPSLFQRFKKRVGGGILLYGPPGCGKTLLARATAGECGAAFFNIAISDILDMYIGESQRKLAAVFQLARDHAPAVLFFDEIEALGGKRSGAREATSAGIVSQFLAEMDGFAQNNEGVLVLGATNVPWSVDPAFRRPGRFDRVVFVPPPDREAREAILKLHLDDRPVDGTIDVASVAGATGGFSGADLQHLIESAADEAIEASIEAGREVPIGQSHVKQALEDVRPTTMEWLTTARNYARYANEGGQYDDVLAFLEKNAKKGKRR